jgi:hypothetical protein
MILKSISDDLFSFLMDRVSGTRFEAFAKKVFAVHFGETFGPLGGIHDGGADGALSSYVQEIQGKANAFVQFSVTNESSAKGKIVDTIEALRKAAREPRLLVYATSRALPKADVFVQEIFESTSVMVQIRDVERIKGYCNTEARANHAFYESFAGDIEALSRAADLKLAAVSEFARDPTVYVYLNYELRERFSKDHLNERVADALIYWSLRDTDPDRGVLMYRADIARAIETAFPAARAVLIPRIDERLIELSKKGMGGLERIRHHRPTNQFCLPFEMRKTLAAEASSAVVRQQTFRESIGQRLRAELAKALDAKAEAVCVELIFSTVHRYFIEQGVVLAAFFEGKMENLHVSDQVVEDIMVKALSEIEHGKSVSPPQFSACMGALRGIFYRSSAAEREYLAYLSRTSCLLVMLQSAPKQLEYLNQMGGNFRLLVGSDLLVKALSERYLEREHQQVTNLLGVCKQLGSALILTEPVLNEVFFHLHGSDLEFRNHYAAQEAYLRPEDIAECDRIMIRAYLHARRVANGPRTWRDFVNQLTDPDGLRSKSDGARQALRALMVQRFGMTFMSMDELESAVSRERVSELAERLDEARHVKHEELSYNDALMVYATYAQRRKMNEQGIYDGFGFRTWWLTKETRVLGLTGEIVRVEGGVPYILRPEFILNFVALAPKAAEVRSSLSGFLPTTAGLQLGQHLPADAMHALLSDAAEWERLTPERVSVMMSDRVNRLKYDRFKQYTQKLK